MRTKLRQTRLNLTTLTLSQDLFSIMTPIVNLQVPKARGGGGAGGKEAKVEWGCSGINKPEVEKHAKEEGCATLPHHHPLFQSHKRAVKSILPFSRGIAATPHVGSCPPPPPPHALPFLDKNIMAMENLLQKTSVDPFQTPFTRLTQDCCLCASGPGPHPGSGLGNWAPGEKKRGESSDVLNTCTECSNPEAKKVRGPKMQAKPTCLFVLPRSLKQLVRS